MSDRSDQPSEPRLDPRSMGMTYPIDNTGAASGLITEHRTRDERALLDRPLGGIRTLCGLRLGATQPALGNTPCKRCERLAGLK